MKKRIISSLMALALCLSLLPTMAFATGTTYAITNGTPESTKETNHGYITIAKANAAEGETVTVEVHPVDGYQLKSLTVTPAFTVTFDLNGITGTAPEAQEVAKDGKVTEPTDPTDTVHTFAGWYKTIDATTGALSDPWNFDTDTVTADMTLYAKWTRTMESILRTNPDIPEVTNLTPPLNAWVNSTSPDCKAFVGIDEEGDTLFVVKKEGQGVQPLGLLMDDTFVRINENTYKYNDNYVTVIANMTDGKFTSCEWEFTLSGYQFLDGTYTAPNSQCIAAGTMISMPGGKQKAVEELEIGDVICTFDHETGEVSSAPIAFIWESKNVGNAFTLTFEDDIEVTVIEEHGFYDYEEQKYVFINLQNAEEYIGHHFYNADTNSWLELKSCEALNDNVDAYAIITSGHLNHMSNGMLSMCDGTVKVLANIFEYDDQMKFDADKKKADIEAYGLTPKEKILELEGFIESDYDDYNLQYLNVAIGKGLTTWEWIEAFSDYCVENGLVDIYSGSETAEENEAPRLLLMSATAPKSLLGSALKSTPQDGIKITAKEDGTYQFTMPGYPVTVTAEFEEITIADILPDDFPTCVDVLPFNTWDNDNGIHMMLNQDALGLITDESQDFVIAEDIRSAALTRSGNNYIFTNNGVTTTFVMSSNTLVSVEVSGLDDEYDSFNGTYAAEMSVVIDDEEAGTIASVARDANGLNLSGISGGTILLLEPKDNSTNKVVEVHYTEADGGNGYAETRFSINQGYEFIGLSYSLDGTNYINITSYTEEHEETGENCIRITGINGCFKLKVLTNKIVTIADVLAKAENDFPTFSWPLPNNVWVNANCSTSKMYIANNGLTFGGQSLYNILTASVTKVEDNFEYNHSTGIKITFVMNSEKLVKITIEGSEAADNNGNYLPPAHTHAPVLVNGQAATESAAGFKDYYECDCGALFEDENGTTPIENLDVWKAQGGNGYIAPLPTHSGGGSTPTVNVPVSGDKDSVKVTATVSGGNATVKNVTSEQLETVGTGENVTIDLSSLSKSVSGVTIPKTTFENVAASEADGLEVKLPNGTTAVFDSTTVAAVAEQAAGSNIQLVVDKENKAEQALTAAQKETVKELNDALVLDAYFVSNGKRISDFKGGEAELTVSYPTTKPVRVWYVAEDGTKELVPSTFDGKAAKFVVTHFSHYAIEVLDGSSYAACPQDNTCVYAKFTDANTAAWYHDGVHYCVENGMMNGVSNTQFAPNGTLTRGMVVTVLARLSGETVTSTGDKWYADGQAWAVANGVSDGTNMTANITREQLATMLYRYAVLKGIDTNKFTENTNTLSYTDVFTISDWATSGMHFCIAAGVVNGDNGMLYPTNTATRAEAAAMFQRLGEKVLAK